MKKVFVLGSINYDLFMYTDSMPILGESIVGHGMISNFGGKGSNVAVASKKIGVNKVYLLGGIGDDDRGRSIIEGLKEHDIDISGLEIVKGASSGTCFIIFDKSKEENAVIVDKGANILNNQLKTAAVLTKHAQKDDIFVTNLETNLLSLYKAVETAKSLGMFVIMNPSPLGDFDKSIMSKVDLLIVNKLEATSLSGVDFKNKEDLIKVHKQLKAKATIITLGKDGAYFINNEEIIYQPAIPTNVVDVTCAGDTFLGALAYRKVNGYEIKNSLRFAATASSIAISRKGTTKSIPNLQEVLELYEKSN